MIRIETELKNKAANKARQRDTSMTKYVTGLIRNDCDETFSASNTQKVSSGIIDWDAIKLVLEPKLYKFLEKKLRK